MRLSDLVQELMMCMYGCIQYMCVAVIIYDVYGLCFGGSMSEVYMLKSEKTPPRGRSF